jgi:hypothetical protein
MQQNQSQVISNGIIQQADGLLANNGLPVVPDKRTIRHVHELRNDAQHKAKYPNETDLSDARTYTRDFLVQTIHNVWGQPFEAISLTDIINDLKVKTYLQEAETALAVDDYLEAIIKSMAALEWTIDEVKDSIVGRIPSSLNAFTMSDGWGEDRKSTEVFKAFELMRDLLMRSMVGITLPEYLRYEQMSAKFVQGISFFQDGHFNVNLALGTPDRPAAEYIVAFVINAVLQIERLVGDINKPFAKM